MIDIIIVAAGSGKRMNKSINKQFIELKNKPILIWTIEKFYDNKLVDNIYLVIKEDEEDYINNILEKHSINNITLVYGGKERQDSVFNCIKYISSNTYNDYNVKFDKKDHFILIHDGARPLISDCLISKTIKETIKNHAVCIGVPAKDTIKIIDENNSITSTPDRKNIWYAQTPQGFRFDILENAYINSYKSNYLGTDDSSLVENYGINVKMILGDYENIKITTPEDLQIAESIIEKNIKREVVQG